MSADEQAIRALIARWLEATAKGDVDAVLSLIAPDAVFLAPGRAPMQGREAFERNLRTVLSDNVVDSHTEIQEIVIFDDLAYCRTQLDVTITSRHGKLPLRRNGSTLSILRKNPEGQWQLTRDANLLGSPS